MAFKFRKLLSSILAVALCATVFTACDQDNSVTFTPNWHELSASPVGDKTETLTYDVSFEKSSGLGFNYSVDYKNGVYTTTLTSSYVDENTLRYRYETSLTITAVYECNGETSQDLLDSVTSWVEFESADKGLRPIKMHKEVKSHSPVSTTANALKDSYVYYETTTDIDYTTGNAKDVTIRPDVENPQPITRDYKVKQQDKYTHLDNEQLLLAVRAIDPESNGSPVFSVYSPYTDKAQLVSARFGSKASRKVAGLTINGTAIDKEISYYPVTMSINDKNSGMSQSLQVATKVTSGTNTYRNVVLRYEVPLSLNLGTLTYALNNAVFM
ncbi:MAG: hypothetical protein IKA40_04370 [Clostridia bacterium]|nr:hypothetical protein [Clostridia bacterium]